MEPATGSTITAAMVEGSCSAASPLQVVRQMRAPLGLAAAEGLVLQVMGVADVIDAGQQAAVEHAVS